jgi:hypothetical protein
MALLLSIVWTISMVSACYMVETSMNDAPSTMEFWGIIGIYTFTGISGVAFIYVVAWVLSGGKNVFPK